MTWHVCGPARLSGSIPTAERRSGYARPVPQLSLYQVDAFASQAFRGNPAAVVPVDAWLDDAVMQAIALENNLSETAFVRRTDAGWAIRWFTPQAEVDLCGHATLATAHVVFRFLEPEASILSFDSRTGPLGVRRDDAGRLVLDLPGNPPSPVEDPAIAEAAGVDPLATLRAKKSVAVLADATAVRAVTPDLPKVAALASDGLIVTAPGDPGDCDFVSRYFAPHIGIDEDPVTGAAHTTLVPYWAERLGKAELFARQVSQRGGELWCRAAGERVHLAGHATLYLQGTIDVP